MSQKKTVIEGYPAFLLVILPAIIGWIMIIKWIIEGALS